MTGDRRVGARAEQKRRWDRENRPPCPECGNPMSRSYEVCIECVAAKRLRRWGRIEFLWHSGTPAAEIAREIGWLPTSLYVEINRMRKAGRDVPLRRPRKTVV